MKVEGWQCRDGTSEEDHDWKIIADFEGDCGIINGTNNIYSKVCQQCGKEVEATSEDISYYYNDEDHWV